MTESLEQEIGALRTLYGSPRDPEGLAFAPLADAYRRAGDFRHAVQMLRDGLERHPHFTPGHVVAAQLYLEKGLFEEAEIAARRAVELDDANTVAWGLLAGALEARGALAQARDARARLAELEGPGPAEPEAEPVLEVAALAPEEAEPVVDLALLAPDEPEAEPVLEVADLAPEEPVLEVAELAPEDLPSDELPDAEPLVTRTMADLYARQGLTERALGVYRQLLQVTPGDAELRRRVAELEGSSAVAAPQAPEEAAEEAPEAEHAWTTAGAEPETEVETPFAWTAPHEPEEAPPGGPSARSSFARMLAWEPRT